MKEVSEQDRQDDAARFARRMRIAHGVVRVIILLAALFWLLVFVAAVRTGYLSRIGVAVGAVFVASIATAPILGWAGRKRLETLFLGVHFGTITLALVAGVVALVWPEGRGTWHPYRFDDELAEIEARRAVPDEENASLRYESVFGEMDTDDEPDFLFHGASLGAGFERRPWKGSDHPQASEWLDSQAQILSKLLAIGRMEKCRWPVQADTYDEYTVPYAKLRHSLQLLVAAGNRDLGEGRVTEALTKYFCTLRIADHIHQQPSEVDCLTGFGGEGDGLEMIRHVLVQNSLSEEDITQIAEHLSRKSRKISGVCGGIGETYDIDPNVIRLLAVFLGLATGLVPMVVTYIAARLLLPWPEQE